MTGMLQKFFKFKGGVKPQTNKTQSVHEPITVAPLPSRLFVPLHQSIGGTIAIQQPLIAPLYGGRSEYKP